MKGKPKWRFAKGSRRRTSAPSLLPSSGRGKSACAPRQPARSRSRDRAPPCTAEKTLLNLSISRGHVRRYSRARIALPVETIRKSSSEPENKNIQERCHDAIHDDS